VIYDSTFNRWVVTADAFNEAPTVQRFFIAVSTTSDPTGPYFIYNINADFFQNGNFFDFPQLGLDQNSVLITANIFSTSSFLGADMLSIAKARLYNGLGFSVPVFTGLQATLAPPNVLDQNSNTFFLAAPPSGSSLSAYRLINSSNAFQAQLFGPSSVSVPSYNPPPNAPQPNTSILLDTSDSRFVNASTQLGNSLWQVHTIGFAGFATPRFYEINTDDFTVKQSNFFYASGSSSDFNASIAVNSFNQPFVTWSSTDPSQGINAQIRTSSCSATPCDFGTGLATFTSPTFLSGNGGAVQRWGDYSAVTIDPTNSASAWIVNETIDSSGAFWRSGINGIGF